MDMFAGSSRRDGGMLERYTLARMSGYPSLTQYVYTLLALIFVGMLFHSQGSVKHVVNDFWPVFTIFAYAILHVLAVFGRSGYWKKFWFERLIAVLVLVVLIVMFAVVLSTIGTIDLNEVTGIAVQDMSLGVKVGAPVISILGLLALRHVVALFSVSVRMWRVGITDMLGISDRYSAGLECDLRAGMLPFVATSRAATGGPGANLDDDAHFGDDEPLRSEGTQIAPGKFVDEEDPASV